MCGKDSASAHLTGSIRNKINKATIIGLKLTDDTCDSCKKGCCWKKMLMVIECHFGEWEASRKWLLPQNGAKSLMLNMVSNQVKLLIISGGLKAFTFKRD